MKIERRYMAHYLNAGFGGAENYCRLGADLEEYSPELTANVEKKSTRCLKSCRRSSTATWCSTT